MSLHSTNHDKIYTKLNTFYSSNRIPHIIFHGAHGSGKRTILNNFLNLIYENDRRKMKSNVMTVNCAHGKGIKFIRDEVKFFAKTNIQSSKGIQFKSIVLMNADYLTIDAQSALRRCIELFSHNTRFFIIVENKHKLLNPILSRFCELYVPEYIHENKIVNLHQLTNDTPYFVQTCKEQQQWLDTKIREIMAIEYTHENWLNLASEIYEEGLACLDVMEWLKHSKAVDNTKRSRANMCFAKIKSEYRNEKLLMSYMFDFLFMRKPNDIKNIVSV